MAEAVAGALVYVGVSVGTAAAVGAVVSAVAIGIAVGAVVGAGVALFTGGDVLGGALKGAMWGGITAGVFSAASAAVSAIAEVPANVSANVTASASIGGETASEGAKSLTGGLLQPGGDVIANAPSAASAAPQAGVNYSAAASTLPGSPASAIPTPVVSGMSDATAKIYAGLGQGLMQGAGEVGKTMMKSTADKEAAEQKKQDDIDKANRMYSSYKNPLLYPTAQPGAYDSSANAPAPAPAPSADVSQSLNKQVQNIDSSQTYNQQVSNMNQTSNITDWWLSHLQPLGGNAPTQSRLVGYKPQYATQGA